MTKAEITKIYYMTKDAMYKKYNPHHPIVGVYLNDGELLPGFSAKVLLEDEETGYPMKSIVSMTCKIGDKMTLKQLTKIITIWKELWEAED